MSVLDLVCPQCKCRPDHVEIRQESFTMQYFVAAYCHGKKLHALFDYKPYLFYGDEQAHLVKRIQKRLYEEWTATPEPEDDNDIFGVPV